MKSVFGALNGLHTQTPETIADNGGHQSVGAIHDHVAHDWALLTIDLSGAVSVEALSRHDTPFRAAVTAQLATGKQTRQREVVLRNADAETAAVADQPTVGGDFAFLAEVGFSAVWLGDVGLSRIGFPSGISGLARILPAGTAGRVVRATSARIGAAATGSSPSRCRGYVS